MSSALPRTVMITCSSGRNSRARNGWDPAPPATEDPAKTSRPEALVVEECLNLRTRNRTPGDVTSVQTQDQRPEARKIRMPTSIRGKMNDRSAAPVTAPTPAS